MENELNKMTNSEDILFDNKPADVFNDFHELDKLDVTSDENSISNFHDISDETKAENETIKTLDDGYKEIDEMNLTKEIDTLKDDVLDRLDEISTSSKKSKNEAVKNIQTAFIYTSTIGFVILSTPARRQGRQWHA